VATRHITTVDFLRKLKALLLRADGHTILNSDTQKQIEIENGTRKD
jgi:hypothetical protein